MKTIQIFNDFTCWLVWNERMLAHWTQVSDRCPLGYLFIMWERLYIARALSIGQCGILMTIDKYSDFGHFYGEKSLKMWKHLYIAQALSLGQCGILMTIDKYSDFGHFYGEKSLKMWKHLYIARALSLGQCGILMVIDTPILPFFMREKSSDFSPFFYCGNYIGKHLHIETFPHFLLLAIFENMEIGTFPYLFILPKVSHIEFRSVPVYNNYRPASRNSLHFVIMTVWNTNDDRFFYFGHF